MDRSWETGEAVTKMSAKQQREADRDSLMLQATLRQVGRLSGVAVRVRNLSAGGMMIESTIPFTIGDAIDCEMRGVGRVAGRIAWTAEGRVGIAFDVPIDPKLARKPVGQGPGTPYYAKSADAGTGVRTLRVR